MAISQTNKSKYHVFKHSPVRITLVVTRRKKFPTKMKGHNSTSARTTSSIGAGRPPWPLLADRGLARVDSRIALARSEHGVAGGGSHLEKALAPQTQAQSELMLKPWLTSTSKERNNLRFPRRVEFSPTDLHTRQIPRFGRRLRQCFSRGRGVSLGSPWAPAPVRSRRRRPRRRRLRPAAATPPL